MTDTHLAEAGDDAVAPRTKEDKIRGLMDHFGLGCYAPCEFENWARVEGLQIVEK